MYLSTTMPGKLWRLNERELVLLLAIFYRLHLVVEKALYLESDNNNDERNHKNTSKYFYNTFCMPSFFLNALYILTCLSFTTTLSRCNY